MDPTSQHGVNDVPLAAALREVLRRPFASLIVAWNWKAASISALLRATMFFATNRHSGGLRAAATEALFAILTAGLMGAFTQRLRNTRPLWATALIIYLGLPTVMLAAQYTWHRLAGTPHLRTGLIISFCFASVSTGFNWFAMRRGAMLAGHDGSTLRADARLPSLLLDFILWLPKRVLERER